MSDSDLLGEVAGLLQPRGGTLEQRIADIDADDPDVATVIRWAIMDRRISADKVSAAMATAGHPCSANPIHNWRKANGVT